MRRWLLGVALALAAGLASAQNTVTFDLDLSSPGAPVLTWSTSPAASSCTASGDWSGTKASSGSEILPPIRTSAAYTISCGWLGDSMAMLSWTNPTQNVDGSPYTDPGAIRLVWSDEGVTDFDCLTPASSGDAWIDRPPTETVHTVMMLSPGSWDFAAFAVNQAGLCSTMSNVAMKMITGTVNVADTISVTVPGSVQGLGAT